MLPIGNTYPVNSASFSPDGKYIVTASWDGTAKIWDAFSGQRILDLKGEESIFGGASFSPDGKSIAAFSGNGVKVWNAISGEIVSVLEGHKGGISSLSFSPNGKYIVTASEDKTAKVWNANSGELVADLKGHENSVLRVSFSFDSKFIATASLDSTVKVWNANSGQLIATINVQTDNFYSGVGVSFSPDGKYIATASADSIGKVWNANSGELVANLKGHTKRVRSASFSPDGKYIITTSNDSTAKVWSTLNWQLVANLKGYSTPVLYASFSPNSQNIITISRNSIKVWNALRWQLQANLDRFFSHASFSPDGKYFVTNYDTEREVNVWNAINGQLVTDLEGHTEGNFLALFSPDGKYILTSSNDRTLRVWNTSSGKPVISLKHKNGFNSASYSPDGKYILTTSHDDSTAKVWGTITGHLVTTLKGHTGLVTSAKFSFDGKYIVTSSNDSTAKIWDAITGRPITTLKGHTSWVKSASFSPDGKYILTTSNDSTIRVWNASNRNIVANFRGWYAFFSPDGKYVVTVSIVFIDRHNKVIHKVWVTATGQLITTLNGESNFSPDGKYIVTTTSDSTAKVWNTVSWQLIAELNGQTNYINRASFSTNGKYLILYGANATFLDAVTFKFIKTIELDHGFLEDIDFTNNRVLIDYPGDICIADFETGKKFYTFLAIDSSDYLVYDKDLHYDGTPAARKLLYFTCDREIIELDQVKDQLWVPNLAERIMKGDSINAKTLDELNICGLTPEVEDSSYKSDEYNFKILPRRGGLGETVLYLNGIEVKRYKPTELKNNGGAYELKIKKAALKDLFVAGKENRLTVKAFTSDNAISSRALNISEDKSKDKATAPNLFAVMVGVSDYKGDELDLKYPGKDATDISAVVSNAAKNLLNTDGAEHVFMYNLTTDKDYYQLPEKKSIKKVLEEIGMKATANDILLIFFAGHGVMRGSEDNKQFYFLTADASINSSFGAVADVGISTSELTEWIKPANIKAQKRIMIFDACNSGQAIKEIISIGKKEQNFLAARGDEKSKQIKAIEKLNERSGMFILSASASDQKAYEMGKYNQGALTYSLLKAIKEQPDILEDRKYLNISRWFSAAEKSVGELARETGARQQPQIFSTTNFNIGVVDDEVRNKIVLPFEKPLFTRSDFRNTDLRVDNLKLHTLVDKELDDLSGNLSDAAIMYSPEYDGINVYAISGDYTITGNDVSLSVILTKGGTEIITKFEIKGISGEPGLMAEAITKTAIDWVKKNK